MGGKQMKIKNSKGFTLIELLIVVAIIAILAAIAIPQFSQYRMKGYNAAALADLRNARTSEEAFYSDWQAYVSTAGNGAVGTVITNATVSTMVAQNAINGTTIPSSATFINFGLSQNDSLLINANGSGVTYTGVSDNTSGNRCYGMDSTTTSLYWSQNATGSALGAEVKVGDISGTATTSNLVNAPGGTCTTAWATL